MYWFTNTRLGGLGDDLSQYVLHEVGVLTNRATSTCLEPHSQGLSLDILLLDDIHYTLLKSLIFQDDQVALKCLFEAWHKKTWHKEMENLPSNIYILVFKDLIMNSRKSSSRCFELVKLCWNTTKVGGLGVFGRLWEVMDLRKHFGGRRTNVRHWTWGRCWRWTCSEGVHWLVDDVRIIPTTF